MACSNIDYFIHNYSYVGNISGTFFYSKLQLILYELSS